MIEIITEADYKDRLAATQNGVLLFFKKLCPHCNNMEKVLEKFGAAKPGIALYGIDIEENAAAAARLLGLDGVARMIREPWIEDFFSSRVRREEFRYTLSIAVVLIHAKRERADAAGNEEAVERVENSAERFAVDP